MNRNIIPLEISPAPGGVVSGPVIIQARVQGSLVICVPIVSSCHALNCVVGIPALVAKVPGKQSFRAIGNVGIDLSSDRLVRV